MPRNKSGLPAVRKPLKHAFKKGNQAAKGHSRTGSKKGITIAQRKFLASTGLTPMQFLSFVYRNELYSDYQFKRLRTATGDVLVAPLPKPGARRIPCDLNHRLSAAAHISPYVHKKMPVAIEGSASPFPTVSPDRLANLSEAELNALLIIMDKLGIAGGVKEQAEQMGFADITDAQFEEMPDEP